MNQSNESESPSEREIFFEALGKSSQHERAIFLDGACFNRPDLRRRIEELLASNAEEDSFLQDPALESVTIVEETPISEGPGTVVGRYKLLQKVGEGGMGVVYMAEQTEPVTRKVALKIIKLGMDTKQVVARFEAERQALAMMDHPNIAKVLDAGATDSGRPYFVMELVRGVPITEYCDKNKLSTQDRLNLFIPVCQAIQHAHQKGVIHRDIKPSNVMVTLHDGNAVPKVIDFGIAKATNQKLTEKTLFTNYAQMIGTPAYMSPEQAEMSGLDVDTRTDVYSLGVLLYELLTGSTPFPSRELLSLGYGEMQKVIAEKEPPKPSTRLSTMQHAERTVVAKNRSMEVSALGNTFKGDLDWIVMKALEKDRTHRYETVNGLVSDIRRHLDNEPVSAAAPTFTYQCQKFYRRNRKYMRAAGVVAGLLILATCFATVQAIRAKQAERVALSAQRNEAAQRERATASAQQAVDAQRLAVERADELDQTLYLNRIARAYQEVQANRLADARQLLQDCPEKLRGWEWHYLLNRCYSGSERSLTIPGGLHIAAISPNGRTVAAITNKTVQLWDLSPTGEFLSHTTVGSIPGVVTFEGPQGEMAFSPNGAQFVVVMTNALRTNFTIRLLDVATREERQTFSGHANEVRQVVFHPNGRKIASVDDGKIRIWDVATGTNVHTWDNVGNAYGIAYSPDGKWLATADWNAPRILDSETGEEKCTLERHLTIAAALAFSPDSQTLVTSDSVTIKLWQVPSGRALGKLEGHKAWCHKVAFSPDGTRLASSGIDRQVKIWDWRNKRGTLSLVGHRNAVRCIAFLPSNQLISGDVNGELIVRDAADAAAAADDQIGVLTAHTNCIWSLAFTPDSRLISSAEDSKGFVWDLRTRQPTQQFESLFDLGVSTNGLYLVAAIGFGRIRILEAFSLKQLFEIGSTNDVISAALSPDGTQLVAGGKIGSTGQNTFLTALKCKRPGIGRTDTLEWRVDGKPHVVGTHETQITDVQFSADGRHLASADNGGTVKLWDATRLSEPQEATVLRPRSATRDIPKIAFSPDSQRLATGDGFNDVLVLDVQTGDTVLTLKGHGETVVCIAFSPDGRFLASGGVDNTVRLWDAATGKLLHTYLGHSSVIYALAFSPNSRILASGGRDQVIRLWRVDVAPQ